jgi:HSP20 family molecular chaperone IbpA
LPIPGRSRPCNGEIDRLFEDFSCNLPSLGKFELMPSMDVESDKEIEVTAELPGLEEKDVEINYADGILTIRGEKKAEKQEKNKRRDPPWHFKIISLHGVPVFSDYSKTQLP